MASPGTSFHLTGQWNQLRRKYDPARYKAKQKAANRAATAKLGMYVSGQMKRAVRGGGFAKNAAFTILLKGSTKPLVDNAELWKAHTWRMLNDDTVFVGVLRTARGKDGSNLANVAEIVQEGAKIKVTPRMRTMFWYLWLVSAGRMPESKLRGRAKKIWRRGPKSDIYPLSRATVAIRVPGRPYMKQVFNSPEVKRHVLQTWATAAGTPFR